MRIRRCLASVFVLTFLFSSIGAAKKKSTPLPAPAHAGASNDYVSALSAANRFLQAWQAGDHEAGLLLLSDSAKHQTSEERLEKYFAPGSTTLRAFQVGHGQKLKEGRYTFSVTLFDAIPGASPRSRNKQLLVVQAGKDDWVVDKLP